MITTLTTCIIIASVATPLLGFTVVLIEKYLKCYKQHDKDKDVYIELNKNNINTNTYNNQNRKLNLSILNTTFLEAASCNCPLLCNLLIEKGATEIDAALAIAIENNHIDTCKAIISSAPCNLNEALSIAQNLKKYKIVSYIQGIIENVK